MSRRVLSNAVADLARRRASLGSDLAIEPEMRPFWQRQAAAPDDLTALVHHGACGVQISVDPLPASTCLAPTESVSLGRHEGRQLRQ